MIGILVMANFFFLFRVYFGCAYVYLWIVCGFVCLCIYKYARLHTSFTSWWEKKEICLTCIVLSRAYERNVPSVVKKNSDQQQYFIRNSNIRSASCLLSLLGFFWFVFIKKEKLLLQRSVHGIATGDKISGKSQQSFE